MAWRERAGWKVEGIFNYGPNVVSFVLNIGQQRWYVVSAYVPSNDAPTDARVEQALGQAGNRVEVTLLGYLSVSI